MSETQESTSKSPIVRVAMASLIGTSIEWYDFFLYGTAAALVLGPLFFSPKLSPLAAQLSAFATFWVGFAARPVGGIVFGHFGDRLGRKTMLILTLLIMGIATFLVGVLPTYKDIGIIAPVLLVILRFAQGRRMGWSSAASDRTRTCSQARVLWQLAADWCPHRASALIVALQCNCLLLLKSSFSVDWLEDPFPAEHCARGGRIIYPAANHRNTGL